MKDKFLPGKALPMCLLAAQPGCVEGERKACPRQPLNVGYRFISN